MTQLASFRVPFGYEIREMSWSLHRMETEYPVGDAALREQVRGLYLANHQSEELRVAGLVKQALARAPHVGAFCNLRGSVAGLTVEKGGGYTRALLSLFPDFDVPARAFRLTGWEDGFVLEWINTAIAPHLGPIDPHQFTAGYQIPQDEPERLYAALTEVMAKRGIKYDRKSGFVSA